MVYPSAVQGLFLWGITMIEGILGAIAGGFINRLRGGGFQDRLPSGASATLLFAALVSLALQDWICGLAAGAAYMLGESFGWSKWINCIPGYLSQADYNLTWLGYKNPKTDKNLDTLVADALVHDENQHYLKYCAVGMTVRGLMWWVPVFSVFAFFEVADPFVLAATCFGLAAAFPATYHLAGQHSEPGKYLGRAEIAYGVVYGLVLGLLLSV